MRRNEYQISRPAKINARRGLLLIIKAASALLTLVLLCLWVREFYYEPAEKDIKATYTKFHEGLHNGEYAVAYDLMTRTYQERTSIKEFSDLFDDQGHSGLELNAESYITVDWRKRRP